MREQRLRTNGTTLGFLLIPPLVRLGGGATHWWPLGLIALGIYLIWQITRKR